MRGGLERTKQLSDCQSVVYPTLHMERNVKPRVHSPSPSHTQAHTPYATLCTRQMPSEEAFQTKQITTKQGLCGCTMCVPVYLR